MNYSQFDKYMQHALDNLPDKNLRNLDNVAIVVEDWPTPLQLKKGEVKRGTLFGLYEGIPKTKRGNNYSWVAPDKITIFKGPLLRAAVNDEHLKLLVDNTVWHEVAHHYGLGHGRIRQLEKKAQIKKQFSSPVEYLQAESLIEKNINHAWFMRHGGVSQAPFASLNVEHGIGDRSEFVEENIRRATTALNLDRKRLVHAMKLAHSDKVFFAKAGDVGKIVNGYDILMTDVVDLPLALNTADCIAILLYDPIKSAIAIIHSGWKGTIINVVKTAIRSMNQHYGSEPDNILAALSPAATKQSYQIGDEVITEFDKKYIRFDEGNYYLDLIGANKDQLLDAGVNNIEISDIDTITDDRFFSFRRQNITGRNFNVISL